MAVHVIRRYADSPDPGTQLRRVLGLILFIAAPALAVGRCYSTREPLARFAQMEQHRTPADSLAYGSAAYHAAHARATQANRWHPTGYATLGILGTIIGAGLLYSARSRRTDS